jgi:hypothetical protein
MILLHRRITAIAGYLRGACEAIYNAHRGDNRRANSKRSAAAPEGPGSYGLPMSAPQQISDVIE